MQKVHDGLIRGFHCLYIFDFRFYFTPFYGFFSSFPHGTHSLSVIEKYSDFEGGAPMFKQVLPFLVLLEVIMHTGASWPLRITGLSPSLVVFSKTFFRWSSHLCICIYLCSLAATNKISVDFFS